MEEHGLELTVEANLIETLGRSQPVIGQRAYQNQGVYLVPRRRKTNRVSTQPHNTHLSGY